MCRATPILLVLGVVVTGELRAEPAPATPLPVPLRKLCLDATAIVLAVPVDPLQPTRFQVQKSLRGPLQPGETIAPSSLKPEQVASFEDPDLAEKKTRPRRIQQALLFLEPGPTEGSWQLLPGGLRFSGEDGKLLAWIPERSRMMVLPEMRWPVMLARVQRDLADLEQLRSYRRIGRASRRVEAMLGWIRDRRNDFTASGPGNDESPMGWDRLQTEVFPWIFASADLEGAWNALRLYADLNRGEIPPENPVVFTSPEGRRFLAERAGNQKSTLGDRIRAVRLLTLSPPVPADREILLGPMLALFAEKNDLLSLEAARWLERSTGAGILPTDRLLPGLMQAYKDAQPGPARDALSRMLCSLASPAEWTKVSGNPPGYCAWLGEMEQGDDQLTFWLTLRTPGASVYQQPTIVVQKLGTLGFVSETKRIPLESLNLPNIWATGWSGSPALVVQLDTSKLTPKTGYKIHVEGQAGKAGQTVKWTSEPQKFMTGAVPPGSRKSP